MKYVDLEKSWKYILIKKISVFINILALKIRVILYNFEQTQKTFTQNIKTLHKEKKIVI